MSMCVRVYVNVCVRVFLCLSALVVVFLPFSPPSPPPPPFFCILEARTSTGGVDSHGWQAHSTPDGHGYSEHKRPRRKSGLRKCVEGQKSSSTSLWSRRRTDTGTSSPLLSSTAFR